MTGKRRLLLVRHAKAEPDSGDGDHARGLTARGRRDAAAVGRWLVEERLLPDLALTSSARRAQETWTAASSELDDPPPVRDEASLYESSVGTVLDLVASTSDVVGTLVVVGHEPIVSAVAVALAGEGSDEATLAVVAAGLPTSGVAVLDVPGPWTHLAAGGAVLLRHGAPRG